MLFFYYEFLHHLTPLRPGPWHVEALAVAEVQQFKGMRRKLSQVLWIFGRTCRFWQHVHGVLYYGEDGVVVFYEKVEFAEDVVIRHVELLTKVIHTLFLLILYRLKQCSSQSHRLIQLQKCLSLSCLLTL